MRSISVYVHVPFCRRRCPYCTFYHVALSGAGAPSRYADTVVREFEETAERIGEPFTVPALYIGGGTPSLLDRASLAKVFDAVRPHLAAAGAEVTIEANPEDVTESLVDALADTGFNRISLGVQSLSRRAQNVLNRCAPETNTAAMTLARSRFDNVSFDLLLGIPGGSREEVAQTLSGALAFEPRHLSVYCLEPGGDLAAPDDGFFSRVDPELCADEYLDVCETLEAAGYHHYEISNFAAPGWESAHNKRYWDGSEYLGVGPSAHSFIGGERYHNRPSLDRYLAEPAAPFDRVRVADPRGEAGRWIERLMLGLRTSSGYPVAELPGRDTAIGRLVDGGLARLTDGNLVLTARGLLVLNDVVHRLADD